MRAWIVICFCAVLALLAVILAQLHPPNELRLAAGPGGGAYVQVADDYAEVLARDGIRLRIVETAGSAENAALLREGKVDAAFLQGGINARGMAAEAVGNIFYEPIVLLARDDGILPDNPSQWKGLRINSGAPGSGTEAAFRDFEAAVELSREDNEHLEFPYDEAVSALLNGDLDIAAFVAPIDAPYLVEAYHTPGLHTLALDHAEAISRRMEYAGVVTVPTGGMSLDPVLPAEPRQLVALSARLVVDENLHPALVNRLTMAAIELHRGRGIITDPGTFPSIEATGLPVNKTARQLIQNGPTTWHDWLPYWMAAQINRVLLLFLPFFFIAVPLLRAVPSIYTYLMRWRVWQHYPEIRLIEDELMQAPSVEELETMRTRLDELDERLAGLRLPPAYRQVQYDARLHLELVQKRIADMYRMRRNDQAG
ncbi:TAXI family TRAP transporter solute-binding subunit [Primorskyibacter sp. S87]|uniref:TAXI family TRAP transporter solute-binding subunit n=1 Tax=Primorskyibacter sp. S87 TaxID=3415126 RepID=UPI003C7BD105